MYSYNTDITFGNLCYFLFSGSYFVCCYFDNGDAISVNSKYFDIIYIFGLGKNIESKLQQTKFALCQVVK